MSSFQGLGIWFVCMCVCVGGGEDYYEISILKGSAYFEFIHTIFFGKASFFFFVFTGHFVEMLLHF